ncbi:MAG: hypothetical protein KDJ36_19090, partial [Hyphomicrobiaceae bacterium]|nr:hypothetical protein [Hyphomicrobiaceae bacterium]
GGIAGDSMAAFVGREGVWRDPDNSVIEAGIARAERPFGQAPGDLAGLRDRLAQVMWDDVGVIRDALGIERGLAGIADCRAALLAQGVVDGDRRFNLTWHDWLNLESLLDLSEVIGRAALARDDSRGAHFREDFPETGVPISARISPRRGCSKPRPTPASAATVMNFGWTRRRSPSTSSSRARA